MAKRKKSPKANPADADTTGNAMSTTEPEPPSAPGAGTLVHIGRLALLAAVALAVYLVVVALSQGQVAGCEEGKDCNAVLASKWAKLFGVPIGAFGAMMYLGMFGLSFTRGMGAPRIFLALSIIGGALWFTGIQAFVLKTFCPWCCTTHALATLGTLLIVLGPRRGAAQTTGRNSMLVAAGAAVAALVVTAIAQIKSPEPQPVTISVATERAAVQMMTTPREKIELSTDELPSPGDAEAARQVAAAQTVVERRATITLHDRFEVSTVELPSLGDAETARHVAVGVFDFSCTHCRKLMKLIKPIVEGYGDELAILKLPGHYNTNGREIQKLMLPVFREAPDVYEALGNELYNETVSAKVSTVRQELERRLGAERLQEILAAYGDWAQARVDESKAVLEANRAIINSGKLPQLMVGKTIEAGNKTSAGHYHKLFEDNFGLKRKNAPRLVCSPDKFDLGSVVAYSQHVMSFTLSNPGSIPVKIDGIKRPKGIVIPQVPKQLAPGADHTIEARLTIPSQKSGKVSAYFEVHSDAADSVIRVPFTADVLNITFDPPSLNFGVMEAGGEAQEMTATLTLDAPAKIGAASCPIRFFVPGAVEEVEENRVYRIKVKAQFEEGITRSRNSHVVLTLVPVDGAAPWPKQIRIPVRARVVAKKSE